ncbi:hypothetical protein SDC9_193600 [bioreactor metagenome]|uniref:Uncharacterized protein n=1 Tax=bioreactor metagenome TaxID=1076179 RepID=A0A645I406_9ZZZZ
MVGHHAAGTAGTDRREQFAPAGHAGGKRLFDEKRFAGRDDRRQHLPVQYKGAHRDDRIDPARVMLQQRRVGLVGMRDAVAPGDGGGLAGDGVADRDQLALLRQFRIVDQMRHLSHIAGSAKCQTNFFHAFFSVSIWFHTNFSLYYTAEPKTKKWRG